MTAEEHVDACARARVSSMFFECCKAIEAHANLGKLGMLCDVVDEERERFLALRARLLEFDGKVQP